MFRAAWIQIALFVALIWGAWALIDQPAIFTTRRPSSLSAAFEDPRNLMRACHERARELYPTLVQNIKVRTDGAFEDHQSFFRPYRVIFDDERGEWLLQQSVKDPDIGDLWKTLARFWDVDGDHYPDEALLLIDSVRGREWTRRIDSLEWSFFASLKNEGNKLAWLARLNSKDWSPSGDCYAWANPVTVLVDWAMMNYRWTPSLAL